MNISLSDVIKVIHRFKREMHYSWAIFMLESEFQQNPRKATHHARQIAAAYRNIRICRQMEMSL
ncbi:hypothetical protein E6W39_18845 [Kitasatospora acidiphila]|uniref:Uncharacterized protein n=1 Tax=Kitasatospora acidiphila TaxID=2567942 RepID=A0A540W4J3_9ACTN|nr:hypothetical protein [Kitasatospora acidiphila]TQF03912.1 hypothetical protein E6W39_18845 [Kitasatospora acidiphila]